MIKQFDSNQHSLKDLIIVWEQSVRDTHDFLSESDIVEIKNEVKLGLTQLELFVFWQDNEIVGFMGINGDRIEALFVKNRGQGIGGKLIKEVIKRGAKFVDVNEQNPKALKFYEKQGFEVYERSDKDDQGRNFPILRMKLKIRKVL